MGMVVWRAKTAAERDIAQVVRGQPGAKLGKERVRDARPPPGHRKDAADVPFLIEPH